MTALSASFLRYQHPDGRICVICDPSTVGHLKHISHPLLSLTDQTVVQDTPLEDLQSKNRHLKSRMRRYIDGDFLYVDADTMAVKPLDPIFDIQEPVALANNHNRKYPDNFKGPDPEYYRKCEWSPPVNGYYLNAGVVFWRDCKEAHTFSDIYIKCVDEIHEKGFVIRDQPAFNRALEIWGGDIGFLPDSFNAQVSTNPACGIDACIWHFYESMASRLKNTYFEEGMEIIGSGSLPGPGFMDRVVSSRIHISTKSIDQEEKLIAILKEKGSLLRRDVLELTESVPKPSSPNTFCTIVASDEMPYAFNLIHSIRQYDRQVHFNIFISDCSSKEFKQGIPKDGIFLHFPEDVTAEGIGERVMYNFWKTKQDAYRASSKGVFINYLIREKGYGKVVYVNCNMFFFNASGFLFDALDAYRIILTAQWLYLPPNIDADEYRTYFNKGLYNAGFIAVNSDATDIMDWWAENTLKSFKQAASPEGCIDQSILNLMPIQFDGVHILDHKGCNVTAWNQHVCRRTKGKDGTIQINDEYPIVFVQFAANVPKEIDPMLGEYFDRYLESLRSFSEEAWQKEINSRSVISGDAGSHRAECEHA